MDWPAVLQSTLLLFAIVNPIGSIPIFLQLTGNMSQEQRARAFRTATISAAAILLVFAFAGDWVLTYVFRIYISDLMAAGGLLLLIIAIDHLVFGSLVRGVLTGERQDPNHIAAVPIACPILAGPGAMVTVLITLSVHGVVVACSCVIAVFIVTWLMFQFIDAIYRFLGTAVCTVLSKVLCLFIAAIGIHLLMQGLERYFK